MVQTCSREARRVRPPNDFQIDDWLIQPSLGRVSRGDSVTRLRPQLMDVLVCLAARAGQTVPRDELLDSVWPEQYIADTALARCIAELRQVFRDDAQKSRVIETIPKRGYRLIAPVTALDTAPPVGIETSGGATGDTSSNGGEAEGSAVEVGAGSDPEPERVPSTPVEAQGADGEALTDPPRERTSVWLWSLAGTLVVSVLTVAAIVLWPNRTTPALEERDEIVLAFANSTGDPVFDDTMKLALAIQLEQSPFLRIVPDGRVGEALKFMGRSVDETLKPAALSEVCQRVGAKASLNGSIAALGSRHVIGLEAVACQTGETLARAQIEVEGKEQVLDGLGRVASEMRRKLGESLASVKRYDVPIAQATTPSLEALKAFSQADAEWNRGRDAEAVRLYQNAIELDSNFALAYARLGTLLYGLGQARPAMEATTRAFTLSDRVSAAERFYISAHYYHRVAGNPLKAIETFETWKQTYSKATLPRIHLAQLYGELGRYSEALEEAQEANSLAPNDSSTADALADAYLANSRFEDARRTAQDAVARHIDGVRTHSLLYELALVKGDTAAAERELEWAKSHPSAERSFLFRRAAAAMFSGKRREARERSRQLAESALSRGDRGYAAMIHLVAARAEAAMSDVPAARAATEAALVAERSSALIGAAFTFGLAGDLDRARLLIDERINRGPLGPQSMVGWTSIVRAAIAMRDGRPLDAIDELESVRPYELSRRYEFWAPALRGEAHLLAGQAREAAAAFQKIIDHPGVAPLSVLYPLACLGLGRAHALEGDLALSRRAYLQFFALWRDADADIPILIRARQEYAKLR